MSNWQQAYRRLGFDWPVERVLRVTMDNPGRMNAADAVMHAELARVWRDIDADRAVSAVIIRGAMDAFSGGGDLDLVHDMTRVWNACARVGRLRACGRRRAISSITSSTASSRSSRPRKGRRWGRAWWQGCWPTSRAPAVPRGSSTGIPAWA